MTRPYDAPSITAALFRPLSGATLERTGWSRPVDIDLLDEDGVVSGYWCGTCDRGPVLLLLHAGDGTIAEDLETWPAWAKAAGANLLLVDYPGCGASGGAPSLSSARQAAEAALAYLLERPPQEVPGVVVLGRSLGSLLAIATVAPQASRRLRGLILESGIADASEWITPQVEGEGVDVAAVTAALEEDFPLCDLMSSLDIPVLVLQATLESPVPLSHGERLASWAGGKQVLLKRGDRDQVPLLNETEYRRALKAFIHDHAIADDREHLG